MTEINQENIDNFHAGRMTEADVSEFQKALESDPSLQVESDFQADVIEGLKEFRKAELKTRLDAINVGPGWMGMVQQSALVKSIGGVLVASVIGGGIYYYGESQKEIAGEANVDITAPKQVSVAEEYIWDLGLEEKEDNTSTSLDPMVNSTVKTVEIQATPKVEKAVTEAVLTKEEFEPTFTAPGIADVADEDLTTSADLDELPETTATSSNDEPINVESENRKSLDIKYKYYDGKLFLSGDFDRAPYEILEINNSTSRRIFVFYLDKYYQVSITDRLRDLPEVKDEKLLKELELIRTNK